MSTLIDAAALAAPVPGPDPAGKSPALFTGELKRLRDAAIEEAAALPFDDPQRLARWREVSKAGQKILADGSKALDVAARVVDALARSGGFAGAGAGFALLRHLADDAWDRVYPKINLSEADDESDPDDRTARRRELLADALDGRANQLNWLDDPAGGAYFPTVLRDVPLGSANGTVVTAGGYVPPAGRAATVTREEVEAAGRAGGSDKAAKTLADIAAARDELAALRRAVEAKYAAAQADDDDPGHADKAPLFNEIEKALEDCRVVAEDMAAAAGGEPPPDSGGSTDEPTTPDGGGAFRPPAGSGKPNRVELYAQLRKVADQLIELEPHSPVPLLIRRAVELQGLAFPELVRQLSQEEKVLGFLERSLVAPPAE